MYKVSRIIFLILVISFGVFMVIYSEKDDSPGGQFLGLIFVILGVIGGIKSKQKDAN